MALADHPFGAAAHSGPPPALLALRAQRERARQDRSIAVRREKRARERELRLLEALDDTQPSPVEREESQRRAAEARAERLARLATPNARRYKRWTRREEVFLTGWWGIKPDEWVARQLGRTVDGCDLRAYHLGIRRMDNHLALDEAAAILGVCSRTITRWTSRGWVAMRRAPIKAYRWKRWSVSEESLRRLVTERSWQLDPAKMRPGHYLTQLAEEAHAREGWLTTAEAAARMNVAQSTVCKWLRRGYGHFVERLQMGGGRNVMTLVRERDLPALAARADAEAAANYSAGARRRVERLRARREGVQGAAA